MGFTNKSKDITVEDKDLLFEEIKQLGIKRDALLSEIKSFENQQKQVKDLTDVISVNEFEITTLNETKKQLASEIQEYKNEIVVIQNDRDSQLKNLEIEIDSKEQTIDSLEEKFNALDVDVNMLLNTKNNLKDQISKLEEEIAMKTKDLKTIEDKHTAILSELNVLSSKLAEVNTMLQSQAESSIKLDEIIESKQSEIIAIEENISNTQTSLIKLTDDFASLTNEIETKKKIFEDEVVAKESSISLRENLLKEKSDYLLKVKASVELQTGSPITIEI